MSSHLNNYVIARPYCYRLSCMKEGQATDGHDQEFLVDAGHEDGTISRNNDFETPLMFAATAGKEETGVYLAKRFPESIPWSNKAGLDAVRPP